LLVKVGVFLPVSGRAAVPEVLTDAAQQAERLGYASVWAAERVVNPWSMTTLYPYKENSTWFVPPDAPFLETLTVLSFLAGVTTRVQIGASVIVLPYRHPLYTARVATSIDTLSKGRLILGVGIGWMPEEFAALNANFKARAAMSEEQLQIFDMLWATDRPHFEGQHYRFEEVAVNPRPVQQPRFPIWIGGESEAARRRAARLGGRVRPRSGHDPALLRPAGRGDRRAGGAGARHFARHARATGRGPAVLSRRRRPPRRAAVHARPLAGAPRAD
jgi:probable F420-dependent oxidoreductase